MNLSRIQLAALQEEMNNYISYPRIMGDALVHAEWQPEDINRFIRGSDSSNEPLTIVLRKEDNEVYQYYANIVNAIDKTLVSLQIYDASHGTNYHKFCKQHFINKEYMTCKTIGGNTHMSESTVKRIRYFILEQFAYHKGMLLSRI